MEIREIREDEREAAFALGSQAFMNGSRDMSRYHHPDRLPRRAFGVWDAAGLQAMAAVIDFEIYLGHEATVSMGGVASVACLPASRSKGYAGLCLKFSLEQMREAGQAVSTLFPFSFAYYDKFGYSWAGELRTYEVKTSILRAVAETDDVRAATEADRPAIAAAYAEFARRYRGAVVRSDKLWNQSLDSTEKEFRYTYIYEKDGRLEGYFSYLGGKREQTKLRAFIALTIPARRALLGLLRRHDMQIEKFAWDAPIDDPLWSVLMHWDLKTSLQPVAQVRIVDIPTALAAWRPKASASGNVIVDVQDECAPWNQGAWRIEFAGGEVQAARTDESSQISLDIRALSQAYFGTPTVPQLRAADRLTVHDEAAYEALRALFDGPPMWMNDSF